MFGKLFGRKDKTQPSAGMSEESFAALARDRILQFLPEFSFSGAGPLRLKYEFAGGDGLIELARIWEGCDRDPLGKGSESFERFIRGTVESLRAAISPMVLRKEMLLPVVRHRQDGHAATAVASGAPVRPLGDEVVSLLVFDDKDSMQYLRSPDLATVGLSEDECWQVACTNLAAGNIDVEYNESRSAGMVLCGGDYESSHLWNDGLWRQIEQEWGVPPVAFVPLRDVLMFVRSDNDIDIARFAIKCLGMARESVAPIAAVPFLRNGGAWVPYDMDALRTRLQNR